MIFWEGCSTMRVEKPILEFHDKGLHVLITHKMLFEWSTIPSLPIILVSYSGSAILVGKIFNDNAEQFLVSWITHTFIGLN